MCVSNNGLAVLFVAIFLCVGWWSVKITERQIEIMQRQSLLSKSVEDISYQIAALSSDVCSLVAIENRDKTKEGAK